MLREGECRGLTTIEMSESKVKKSFTCQGPFPPLTPTPLCWKSVLHSLWWVRREYFDYGSADVIQESRGSPTASEEETFDWDRSTLQPSGEPDISRTQKTNFLFRGNTLSVWEKRERERERTGEGQDVFTLGWMPTIRETSVLSEKVKASEHPLVQLQIQATACTQRTLSLDSTELPAPSNLLTLFPRSPLFSRELTLCSYDEHLLRSSQCLAPEPSFVVGKEDSGTIGPIV